MHTQNGKANFSNTTPNSKKMIKEIKFSDKFLKYLISAGSELNIIICETYIKNGSLNVLYDDVRLSDYQNRETFRIFSKKIPYKRHYVFRQFLCYKI